MICPNDREQMVNFVSHKETGEMHAFIEALPSGGIATDEVYETWYMYECPKCKKRVKEAYRCEVLLANKEIS